MPGFQRFVKHNMIEDSCLKLAIQNINLIKIKKDEYIFREGNKTREFFGIIKGSIAIRKMKPDYEDVLNTFVKNKKILKQMRVMSKLYFTLL